MSLHLDARDAIHRMLNAQSLAVVGASSNTAKFGGMTMETRFCRAPEAENRAMWKH